MHAQIPQTWVVLGYGDENLRVHLCLCGSRPGHHHLLRSDDPAAQERSSVVWLQREGQELATDHPHGPGGRGGLHHLLDSHPHLHHRQDHGVYWSQEPLGHGQLAPLHRAGLHQQQPQPCAVRLLGWELQEVLQGFLPALSLPPGAEQLLQGTQQHKGACICLCFCTDREAACLTRHGPVGRGGSSGWPPDWHHTALHHGGLSLQM